MEVRWSHVFESNGPGFVKRARVIKLMTKIIDDSPFYVKQIERCNGSRRRILTIETGEENDDEERVYLFCISRRTLFTTLLAQFSKRIIKN